MMFICKGKIFELPYGSARPYPTFSGSHKTIQIQRSQPHAGTLFLRYTSEFFSSIVPLYLSVFQVEDPVDQFSEVIQSMFGYYDRFSLCFQNGKKLPEILDREGVKIRRWLIQDEKIRFHGRRRSTCNLLFLSSGKREDTPVKQLTEPQPPGHLLYSLSHSFLRKAVIFRPESKFTGSIYIEELGTGILEHRTHFFRNVKQRQFPRLLPIQTDSPRKISFIIVGDQSVKEAGQGCLSASRFSAEENKRAILYPAGNMPQRSAFLVAGTFVSTGTVRRIRK